MNAIPDRPHSDPPRFTVRVSEFTVSAYVAARNNQEKPRAEFALTGTVDFEPEGEASASPHPLAGRHLSVAVCGGKPRAEDGCAGWIQFVPGAPEITAGARILCCPRRVASLRATAHHAAGPMGGRLELILDVGPRDPTDGPVWRIPIRDALIRATRRFDLCPATGIGEATDAFETGTTAVRETSAAR